MIRKISIITVTCNDPDGLRKTLKSVLRQTVSPYEYLIWDASPAELRIADLCELGENFMYHHAGADEGVYDGMNKAVKKVEGDWILFLNSGDSFASEDIIKKLISIDHDDCDVIFGDCQVIFPSGISWRKTASEIGDFKRGMTFSHQSVLVRRELLNRYPFTVGRINSDYEFFFKIKHEGYRFKKVSLCISQVCAGGMSDLRRIKKHWEDFKFLLDFGVLEPRDYLNFLKVFSVEFLKRLAKIILPSYVKDRLHEHLKSLDQKGH